MPELPPSVSNRVTWELLKPDTYEDMVSVLISRLHPTDQRIDGKGGDGGRDVQIPTDDGLVLFELENFVETLGFTARLLLLHRPLRRFGRRHRAHR